MTPHELTRLLYLLDALEAFPTRKDTLLSMARADTNPSPDYTARLDSLNIDTDYDKIRKELRAS